jgi:hypothetical protein
MAAALLLAVTVGRLSAQGGLDRLVILGGTTTMDAQGRHWAYLTWQANDPGALRGQAFALYAKSGDAASGSPYERQAIVRLQTDPVVLQPLLQRSVQLGQDLNALEATINNLFEKLMPDPTLPLPQKLSAVIRGSIDHPDHFKNLLLLARMHSAVGLCLGWAHAAQIPGPVGTPATFELRAFDPVADRDLSVIGRVTVRAGQPVVLPAPGAPVEVHDLSPKGDINAKMRWSTPDALRRLSMLQHGFNLYRVPAILAEQNNWHVAPPTAAGLLALIQANPFVHRLNTVPVLNPRDLTAAEALDLVADPETFFYSDWNDRFNPNTSRPQDDFVNGAQFYYFVTARDLLGRDGLVSPGTLMTICDRLPPQAPSRVRVVNHYNAALAPNQRQRLQVIWNQNVNTPSNTTTEYYVYRWSGLPELHLEGTNLTENLIAGPILHQNNARTNSYLDNGAGAPGAALHAGQTFWYTVVARDNGACAPGGNFSPHSAPAYGVIRDRVGPAGGSGEIEITCTRPEAHFDSATNTVPAPDLPTNARHYRLTTQRENNAIIWAEYFYDINGAAARTLITRQMFSAESPDARFDFALPKDIAVPNPSPRFYCRVGAANGKVSELAVTPTLTPTPDKQIRLVQFSGTIESERTTAGGDCHVHDPHGGGDGTLDEICVTANLSPGTKEVKIYRRVENSSLTLVCQREADQSAGINTVTCCDGAIPAQPSDLCYYVQQFDEHGNAGPMVRIGCVETAPNAPLPTPILSPLTSGGTSTNARMTLRWFCPPYGVERFEVWVAGNPLPASKEFSPDLTLTNTIELGLPLPGVIPSPKLLTFLSRRIGPSFGENSVFTTEADVIVGNHYAIFVRAVGKDGSIGPKSNTEQFSWHLTPEGPVTDVAWPARPLPAVTLTNFPGVHARLFHTSDQAFLQYPHQTFEGIGVRVGALTIPPVPPSWTNTFLGQADPLDYVYRSARDLGLLFPLAVYRTQIPNAAFPEVSDDLIQVTPLMEEIAFDRSLAPTGANAVFIHDPFIRMIPKFPTQGATDWELYLLDTQPIVEDATYQYFLLRLDPTTREITEVTPTNPVTVVPAPL